MQSLPAQLAFAFAAGLVLSCLAAIWTAWRYRWAMRRLMSAPDSNVPCRAVVATAPAVSVPPVPVSLHDNRRAALRLVTLLIGVSFLIGVSAASLWYAIAFRGEPFRVWRVAVTALVDLWPAIPAIGLARRWSKPRVLLTLAAWALLCFGVAWWRSIDRQAARLLLYLAVDIGVPLLLVALLYLGDAVRAVTPWLVLPFTALIGASLLGLELLDSLVERRAPVVLWLAPRLDPRAAMALFALLPWLLAWWPLRRLGRALGHAYARKWLSELLVLFTAVWAIALLVKALSSAGEGPVAALLLLPLLWIPIVFTIDQRLRLRREPGRPPTLLVLRVFQRDAQVQDLFDHVVERWRLTGNTVLIAGTDLADRTLDADDIFTFLDGRLAQRFIGTPADVTPRLAAFDMARDADGRFRVNECYCHDTTWQDALQALVQRSDVVLMDLRGFQAHNAGCRYELGALARSPQALRVVVLTDAQTDRAAAAEAVTHAPVQRFTWLDTAQIDARKRRDVLASLFADA